VLCCIQQHLGGSVPIQPSNTVIHLPVSITDIPKLLCDLACGVPWHPRDTRQACGLRMLKSSISWLTLLRETKPLLQLPSCLCLKHSVIPLGGAVTFTKALLSWCGIIKCPPLALVIVFVCLVLVAHACNPGY
jgi:hypothetical protein